MSSFCLHEHELQQNKKRLCTICALVLALHIFFLGIISPNHREKKRIAKPTKLAVRTVNLTAPAQAAIMQEKFEQEPVAIADEPVAVKEEPAPVAKVETTIEATVETIKEPEKKQSSPEVKKAEPVKPIVKKATPKPKPVVQPKPIAKPKPVVKKPPAPVKKSAAKPDNAKIERERLRKKKEQEAKAQQNALVADALASLNSAQKYDQKKAQASYGKSGSKVSAKQIQTLASESLVTIEPGEEILTGREKTYYDELVQRLKLNLRLPDYGDVKVRLTLSRAGKVIKVECTSSKSGKNSAHLKKMIPTLTFPAFGQNFPKEAQHTFALHFAAGL